MFFLLSLMGNLTYGAGVSFRTTFPRFTVTDMIRSCCIPLRNSTSSRTCLGLLGLSEPFSKMPSSSCNSTCMAREHQLSSDQVNSSLYLFIHSPTIDANMSSSACNSQRNLALVYYMDHKFTPLCRPFIHCRLCRCWAESRYKLTTCM